MKTPCNILTLSVLVLLSCDSKKKDTAPNGPDEPQAAAGHKVGEDTDSAQEPASEAPPKTDAEKGTAMPTAADDKAEQPTGTIDFDALADAANANTGNDLGPNNTLFAALYRLEKWELLTFPDSKSIPPGLNLETHDGKQWVMAFTDFDRMFAYAKERKQLNADGTMMGLSVPSQTSFDFFESLKAQGVFGVRFNQGDHGWFVPMDNLRGIHSYLLDKKLL